MALFSAVDSAVGSVVWLDVLLLSTHAVMLIVASAVVTKGANSLAACFGMVIPSV